jgi:hypothetical protein
VIRRSPNRPGNSRLNDGGARLRPFGLRLTRRSLLAASGATLAAGTPLAVAACGETESEDEDVSPERQAELMNQVLPQELAVLDAADAVRGNAPAAAAATAAALADLRDRSTQALDQAITDLEGTPDDQAAEQVGGESPTEALARQLETSIAASEEAIGELPPEHRLPILRAVIEDAAALAALRDALGEEPAPDAFVMGPPAEEAA